MFLTLLVVTFVIAASCSFVVARLFNRPILAIVNRITSEELGVAWHRYITFAIYIVGISGGVRIWELQQYVTASKDEQIVPLNLDRWILEAYKTIISTLQSTAWMLL